jgi:hypothetical protein
MVWLFVTAVGFLAVTALVMGLARSSTAEWEREKRLSRAPQRDAAAVSPPPAAGAVRLFRASLRTAAAAPRVAGALAGSLRQGLGDLPQPRRLLSRLSPVRRALGTLGAAAPGRLIRRWTRGTSGVGDLTDGNEQGGGAVVEQPVRRPRTRRSSGILRRRGPFRLPTRPHRSRSGASRPDAAQRPVDMTPGGPAQDDPG